MVIRTVETIRPNAVSLPNRKLGHRIKANEGGGKTSSEVGKLKGVATSFSQGKKGVKKRCEGRG